jgi:hypothetical protein
MRGMLRLARAVVAAVTVAALAAALGCGPECNTQGATGGLTSGSYFQISTCDCPVGQSVFTISVQAQPSDNSTLVGSSGSDCSANPPRLAYVVQPSTSGNYAVSNVTTQGQAGAATCFFVQCNDVWPYNCASIVYSVGMAPSATPSPLPPSATSSQSPSASATHSYGWSPSSSLSPSATSSPSMPGNGPATSTTTNSVVIGASVGAGAAALACAGLVVFILKRRAAARSRMLAEESSHTLLPA